MTLSKNNPGLFNLDGPNVDFFARLAVVGKLFNNLATAAAAAGVAKSTFQRWLAGHDPSFSGIVRLCKSAQVSLEWLATGRGDMHLNSTWQKESALFALVPRYDVRAAGGHGAVASEEEPSGFLSFRRDWVRDMLGADPARLAVINATGDSMEPLIHEGDLLLVDLSVTVPAGDDIYVLERDGDLLVKKVHPLLSGALIIDSLNQAYAVEAWSPGVDHRLRFVGRVRMISRAV